MSSGRIFARIGIIVFFAILGASAGVAIQALRITGKPSEFRSLAKLVAGFGPGGTDIGWRESPREDLYGTIIETIESAEMKRRALERVRALHPELRDGDVDIRVAQTKGSAILYILATGNEPKYTRIFLDSLLDEFMAFRQAAFDQRIGRSMESALEDVVKKQKNMEAALEAEARARSQVESLEARAEQERRVARLTQLRDQRDDLKLELKSVANSEAGVPLEARIRPIEEEIHSVEAEVKRFSDAEAVFRMAAEKYAQSKTAYEKAWETANKLQERSNSDDSVAIQERATPAAENVEDWTLPIAVGAVGGGILGIVLGLLLNLLLLRPPPLTPSAT